MTLFSSAHDAYSHRTRLVLAEKGISIDIVNVEPGSLPEDLLDLNPYHSVPTLVDRDLVLYDSRVIIEYLDERFPHPPLMPVDPVKRAQFRLALYRIERDWYGLAQEIERDLTEKRAKNQATKLATKEGIKPRRILRDSILATSEVFEAKPFFLSDEFSLVDASIAPILWRLPYYDIDLPAQAQAVVKYANTLFARPSFRDSLSAAEQEMRTPTG
jgi:RNA polymerase-associated protein